MTNSILFFSAAVACLFVGHVIKAARWGLFITPFQAIRKAHLMRALAVGYVLNMVVPFRLGELVRAISLSRQSGLPLSHALSTTALDRMCDLLVATVMAALLAAFHVLPLEPVWPLAVGGCVLTCLLLVATNNWLLKRTCYGMCAIFNDRIRRWLLMASWSFFTAVRMLTSRRVAVLFTAYTIAMWAAYVSAFYLISMALFQTETSGFIQRLSEHYLVSNLHRPSLDLTAGSHAIAYLAFLMTPLVLIVIYGSIQAKLYQAVPIVHDSITKSLKGMFGTNEHVRLLPFLDARDQLLYLESFFTSYDSRAVLTLLEQNRDIAVLRNVSGGSNATTMLAIRQDVMLFRKYAVGPEADRLRIQCRWLTDQAGRVPVTRVIEAKDVPGYFSYDMPHQANTYDLFTFIHSHDIEQSWSLIRTILDTICVQLHQATRQTTDERAVTSYILDKYAANIHSILQSPRCAALASGDDIVINNQSHRNLRWFFNRFDPEHIATRINGDMTCTVHGDLTAENIIVDPGSAAGYYLIDPNPVNLFNSQMIDFSKLRQSLNLGYEFMIRESMCRTQGGAVIFRNAISQAYLHLNERLEQYVVERFGQAGLQSMCFHELVNFARLTPYQIRKNDSSAHLFYTALVILQNRYHDRFPT